MRSFIKQFSIWALCLLLLPKVALADFQKEQKFRYALRSDSLEVKLDSLMERWHLAAAEADAKHFFELMADDAIYIGTDPTERWLASELQEWSQAAFEEAPAWDFKALERNWGIDSSKTLAWCDEILQTWMGKCRATAILRKEEDCWRIIHYQLSVTVLNEKMENFLAIDPN
jgi:ketosteroid isomerase-like protein